MIGRRLARAVRHPATIGLSTRIRISYAVGALLVSVAVATTAYQFTRHYLVEQQERNTLHQAYVNAALVQSRLLGIGNDVPTVLDSLAPGEGVSEVIYTRGRWYSSSLLISRDALPASIRAAALNGRGGQVWATIQGAPRLVVGVPLPSLQSAYFEVSNQSELQHDLDVMLTGLIAAACIVTVAGGLLGVWASRRVTAPLRTAARLAGTIAAGQLHVSLPPERDPDLAMLVNSLNEMVTGLRARIERDARFAADVSHELRTPVQTLVASARVLQSRRDELSERGQAALDLLTAETNRFQRLVDDLLEISRPDAADVTVDGEEIDVARLLGSVLRRDAYAGIPLSIAPAVMGATIVGDKRRLEQVMSNLLDNALQHGGGATEVAVAPSPDGAGVLITVDDAGPGVAVSERNRIFERFARSESARRSGGSGLGLALVREHVRLHHGRVTVADAPNGGARFIVELPTCGG